MLLRTLISTPQGELKDDSAASEQEDDKYPEYQTVIRYLYPFSVDSKSFMKIRRLKNKLPCDQPQKFWVDYSLDEKELGFKLQSLDMVFLVSFIWGETGDSMKGRAQGRE